MSAKPITHSILQLTRRGPFGARRRCGAAMVEFSLFFLAFFSLTVGLLEIGMTVWSYETLAYAAREGARYAIVHGSVNPIDTDGGDKSIEQVVKENAIGLTPSDITVTTTYPAGNKRSELVSVQVAYTYNFLTGTFLTGGAGVNLGTKTTMVIAN